MSENPDNVPPLELGPRISLQDVIDPPAGRQHGATASTRSAVRSTEGEASTAVATEPEGYHSSLREHNKSNSTSAKQQEIILPEAWLDHVVLPFLPEHHPLANTHIRVETTDTNQGTLLKNLVECFYAMSFRATYSRDPVSAEIVSFDYTELSVWLFLSADQQEFVVDIQHLRGDALEFQRCAQFIMEAAKGKFDLDYYNIHILNDMEIHYLKTAHTRLQENHNEVMDREFTAIVASLNMSRDLLRRDDVEAKDSGIQSLTVLSNPRRTGVVSSIYASHAVLLGVVVESNNNEDVNDGAAHEASNYPEIREAVIRPIQIREILADATDGENTENQTFVKNLIVALDVLINALEVVVNLNELLYPVNQEMSSSSIVDRFLSYARDVLDVDLIVILVFWLANYENLPHPACRAATVLKFFCQACENRRQVLLDLNAMDAASAAYRYGVGHHAKLESQAMALSHILNIENHEE